MRKGLEAGVAFTKGDGEIALPFRNGELFEWNKLVNTGVQFKTIERGGGHNDHVKSTLIRCSRRSSILPRMDCWIA